MSASTTTQVVEKVTEVTRTDTTAPAMVGTLASPVMDTRGFMTRHNLWAYLLVALIVVVIIFWLAFSNCKKDIFDKLHCRGVEWIKGSSGRVIMGLFLVIALMLAAWASSCVAGAYRCMGDLNRSNLVMGAFGLLMLLVLVTFVLFYRGSFTTAYYFAIVTFLMALLMVIMFAYYGFTGSAIAMGLFALWALMVTWVAHKVSCQNPCSKGSGSGSGSSGSSSSPRGSPHGSPSSHH
jgi:hypothetical protein